MPSFNLQKFIKRFGTGIEVIRQTVVINNNPETLISGGSLSSETVVFSGFRFIENASGGGRQRNNIQNEYGVDTKAEYHCHFFNTDDIKNGDIIRFNPSNEKKRVAFNPSLEIVEIELKSKILTGFPNHKLFKGVLNF